MGPNRGRREGPRGGQVEPKDASRMSKRKSPKQLAEIYVKKTFGVANTSDFPSVKKAYLDGYEQATNDQRGRFTPCRGCPTIDCTCFTELEQELLDKASMPSKQPSGG